MSSLRFTEFNLDSDGYRWMVYRSPAVFFNLLKISQLKYTMASSHWFYSWRTYELKVK